VSKCIDVAPSSSLCIAGIFREKQASLRVAISLAMSAKDFVSSAASSHSSIPSRIMYTAGSDTTTSLRAENRSSDDDMCYRPYFLALAYASRILGGMDGICATSCDKMEP